jgi:hypothetical protein
LRVVALWWAARPASHRLYSALKGVVAHSSGFAQPHSQLAIAYERQGRADEAAAERAKAEELAAKK